MLRGFGQITNSRTRRTRKIQEKLFRLLLSRPWRILGESLASFASGCLYFRPLPMKNFCLQRLSSKRWQLFKP